MLAIENIFPQMDDHFFYLFSHKSFFSSSAFSNESILIYGTKAAVKSWLRLSEYRKGLPSASRQMYGLS